MKQFNIGLFISDKNDNIVAKHKVGNTWTVNTEFKESVMKGIQDE